MPRTSEEAHALEDIEASLETAACAYILASDSEEEEELEDDIEDLLLVQEIIASHLPDASAGKHDIDILEAAIREYPETAFLALFRMHRASFWQLVEMLTQASEGGYWDPRAGQSPRAIYQQIAVALYILGGGGGATERSPITVNIDHDTVWTYTWRTIDLLASLMRRYIRWPQRSREHPTESGHRVFRRCIGFLDGSHIVLRDKPMVDPEAYLSRKKTYGFNLQAICNWKGRFIWVQVGNTANVHDSTAWKSTVLHRQIETFFEPEEYILADKAYSLEKHVITPYKQPAARLPANAAFNYELSIPRAKIEYAFGVLKARWPTLSEIPVRIDANTERCHKRVVNWTMACVVLYNFLKSMHDDETWLGVEIKHPDRPENVDAAGIRGHEENTETKCPGVRRRDELRGLFELLRAQA